MSTFILQRIITKLFAKPEYKFSTTHTVGIIQQLVKLVKIPDGMDADNNLEHWIIDGLQNVYLKNSFDEIKKNKKILIGPQGLLVRNENPETIKSQSKMFYNLFGRELEDNIESGKVSSGDDFIIEGIKRAEGTGGVKYKRYFRGLEKDPEFIAMMRRLVKFIALCLSGQLKHSENFYSRRIDNTKVDYSLKTINTIQEIRAIIVRCLISYFESTGQEYSKDLTLYVDPKYN
jgi:hypothetical protein